MFVVLPLTELLSRSPSSELRNIRSLNASLQNSWSLDLLHLGLPPDALSAKTLSFATPYAVATSLLMGVAANRLFC